MATTVLGLKTFAASDPVDYNEVNDNYNKIDNGVKTALQGRAAHNLLDNSDFRNPVNQRGITSQIGGGYGLDRWRADGSGTISVESTGISLTNLVFGQPVPLKAGTYTLAFHLSDGRTLGYVFKFDGSSTLNVINSSWNETTGAYVNCYKHSTGVVTVQIVVAEGYTITVAWAALYEGSYDASTLPAYQPKGYAAELAECMRYYQQYNTNGMSAVGDSEGGITYIRCMLQVPMRTAPSLVQSSVEMWATYSGTTNKTEVFTFYASNPQCVHLKCTSNTGSAYQLVIATNNAAMAFSADL